MPWSFLRNIKKKEIGLYRINMKKLSISIREKHKQYSIFIGSSILPEISKHLNFSKYSQIAIITDHHLADWLPKIHELLPTKPIDIILKPGETEKTIETVQIVWKKLIEAKFDRKSLILNVGGGITCDMGGFAAATYMRGIDFIQIPTTLLSMVDASVGGKLAVDLGGYKNIVGAFVQPKAVIIDVDFLNTLPDREFISGFAEIIKHGLIADKKYFELVTSKLPDDFSTKEMIEIIQRSCEIKSNVVEKDEHESGLRKILNFGHTIGHAIESLSLKTNKPLLHGEAIAIGMIAEAKLSSLIGNISEDDFNLIKSSIEHAGLPTQYSGISSHDVIKILQYDKKNENGAVKWSLLKKIGEAVFDVEVKDELIIKAINCVIS